jgi:DNA (cytosine-5)-methyltransferase 1
VGSKKRPASSARVETFMSGRPKASTKRKISDCSSSRPCRRCKKDRAFLRAERQPRGKAAGGEVIAVDLFTGCGGMTVGVHEAVRRLGRTLKIALAVDCDPAAIAIYKKNFPSAAAQVGDVSALFDGALGAPLTASERKIVELIPDVGILLGGPPCQGHSDLNNHTRRRDPKNALYLRRARAAEVLLPSVVVIENVTAVQWDEGGVVEATKRSLAEAGYVVAGAVIDLRRIGVPQRRKRFVLVATRIAGVEPTKVLAAVADCMPGHADRTVRWAIGDLLANRGTDIYDTASRPTKENSTRMKVLFDTKVYDLPNEDRPKCHRDGNHSYVSMYGRLRWDRAAQTITTGFGSMGQGRYVHPQRPRTLTPHEAARLQTFPDWFDFGEKTRRGVLATVIGNAVPPLLMVEIGRVVLPAVVAAAEASVVRKRA